MKIRLALIVKFLCLSRRRGHRIVKLSDTGSQGNRAAHDLARNIANALVLMGVVCLPRRHERYGEDHGRQFKSVE